MSITFDHKGSTPNFIIFITLVLGLTSPFASGGFAWLALYHLHETQDMLQVCLFGLFAVCWPLGWIVAMTLGALHPLFGKTVLTISEERIRIQKYLFRYCWKTYCLGNDARTTFALASRTEQRPGFQSSMIRSGENLCTVYRLEVRNGSRRIILHESYDKCKEETLLHDIHRRVSAAQ